MAWDEWKKNTLARHAHVYPDVWYGVWSGPDTYNSNWSNHPGETCLDLGFHVLDFPVLNIHSHACYLYGAVKFLGVEFTPESLTVAPEIPVESYKLESPLLGVVKKAVGRYEGWYAPSKAAPVKRLADGTIEVSGASEEKKALKWTLS